MKGVLDYAVEQSNENKEGKEKGSMARGIYKRGNTFWIR
jgi:hypothetical protein